MRRTGNLGGRTLSSRMLPEGLPQPLPSAQLPTPGWLPIADCPMSRIQGACFEPFGGDLYFIGNDGGFGAGTHRLYTYDPGSDTWTRKADPPFGGFPPYLQEAYDGLTFGPGPSIVMHANRSSGGAGQLAGYDPGTDTWTSVLTGLPSGGDKAGATFRGWSHFGGDNLLHALGGQDTGSIETNLHYTYDPGTGVWATSTVLPDIGEGAAEYVGGVLTFWGLNNGPTGSDPITYFACEYVAGAWSSIPSPGHRVLVACDMQDGSGRVWLGADLGGSNPATWSIYDPSDSSYMSQPGDPQRAFVGACKNGVFYGVEPNGSSKASKFVAP